MSRMENQRLFGEGEGVGKLAAAQERLWAGAHAGEVWSCEDTAKGRSRVQESWVGSEPV